MSIWFYNRPLDKANPTELKIAEVLNQLPDGWRIRWGYFYERKANAGLRDKEGDFILLGPDGRILVMEVKGGLNRHFVLTGEWEHGNDNPAKQLFDEWAAVIDDLKANFEDKVPYVGKALCLPHVNLTEQDRLTGELGRECFIFSKDLKDIEKWWREHMETHKTHCSDPVKAFHKGLAKGLQPESVKLFIKQSDRLFDQFKATESEILDQLQNNGSWMVEGGVGTGKTFLALKQASWLAEQGEGRKVLFLAYNLLLAERLKHMTNRLELKRGQVEVRSWEELLEGIIATEELRLEIPEKRRAKADYFQKELPEYVSMTLEGGQVKPTYDALVVDEAQDHDTAFDNRKGIGWWSWYFALLKKGADAPIAIFYDRAQRPDFRGAEKFDPDVLRAALKGAVHVHLKKALRYTLPIFQYLKSLQTPETSPFVDSIEAHELLPAGIDVITREAFGRNEVVREIESIISDWKKKGLCQPTDIVLIGRRKSVALSSLGGNAKLCGFEVADYNEDVLGKIHYISAHRAKGMDFLAVILIDFASWPSQPVFSKNLQEAYFIGASRARQLLAVVTVEPEYPVKIHSRTFSVNGVER